MAENNVTSSNDDGSLSFESHVLGQFNILGQANTDTKNPGDIL